MGSNSYFAKQQLPTPTKEMCSDPSKLADYLSKVQLRLNQELTHVRVIKCPNCVIDAVNSGDAETLVQIKNPGFQIGSVFFSHAIFTHRASGGSMAVPIQSAAGFLRDLRLTTEGGAVFNVVIPSSPAGKRIFDAYVVVIEGEGTAR